MTDQGLSSLLRDLSASKSGDRPPPPSDRQGGGQAGAGIPSPPPPIHPQTFSASQQPEIIFSDGKGLSGPDPVLCPECEDWTVPDEDGNCPMCGEEPRHYEHDEWDMER